MTGRRLLLVSYLFPPYAGIGALRTGKLAKFLTERGWDVRALAADTHEAKSLPLEIPADHVRHTGWFEVDHALDRFVPAWYRRKPAVPAGAAAEPAATGASAESGGESRLRAALRRAYVEMVRWPDNRIGWLPEAVRAGREMMRDWRPDLIYASAPPFTSLIVADRLSRETGVPWVAELRDLWLDHPYYSYSRPRRLVEQVWERRVLGRADGLVTVSRPWAERLRRKYGKPIALIMNGYVLEDFPELPPAEPSREGPLRIVYTGHIYEGYRDPSPLFEAIAGLGPLRDKVVCEFVGTSNEALMPLARRHGVEDRVLVRPPIPYRDSLRLQMQADVLLHLQWNDPREEGTISGKLFEYVAARRPVLGLGYDAGSVAAILRDQGAGIVRNDAPGIRAALEGWIAAKEAGGIEPLPESAAAGLSRADQYAELERFLLALERQRASRHLAAAPTRDPVGFVATPRFAPVAADPGEPPTLVALVDTEEDFDWRQPFSRESFGVNSLASLPKAQALFDRFGIVPTYLVDYPVVASEVGRELLRGWAAEGRCVIGAQLHPWVNPPHDEAVNVHNSFAGNLPPLLERQKLLRLIEAIETGCAVRPQVYKAGRYGLGSGTLALLEELGFLVDTSVVPRTDYSAEGGPDYSGFGPDPFWFGRARPLLELPVTRGFAGPLSAMGPSIFPRLDRSLTTRKYLLGPLARINALQRITLTPEGITLDEMKQLTMALMRNGQRIFTFSFHSPSLSPGNTPYVRTEAEAQRFFATVEGYLDYFRTTLGGRAATPLELHRRYAGSGP